MHRGPSARTAFFICALAAIAAAYGPGLSGAFLFDDYANLYGLDALNEQPSAYALAQYALGGASSALGRPLAQLTFALQHASWDQRPQDFLAVNLLLHLANAALWFGVVRRLQRLQALPAAPLLPYAACAIWALLPVHGGAVLYVVQRMTLLATTCALAGLLLYLAGRGCGPGQRRRALALMSLGIAVAAGLGTLAKENAALVPVLVLALEATLLRTVARPAGWRLWSALFLWVPALALAGYLAASMPHFLAGYGYRPFTLGERVLTEARLLFYYVAKAVVPTTAGIRFHYDDFALSTSPWQPWTTLAALAGWMAVLAAAVALRRRAPLFAFAVAWYLVGHLLESTFIPLELAFDHRNYLPSLAPVLALCTGALWLWHQPALQRMRGALAALAALYVAALVAGLWFTASLWGRPLEQAAFWVQRQPESRRAVYHYGDLLLQHGKAAETATLYRGALARWPGDAALAVSLFRLGCDLPAGIDAAAAAQALTRYDGNASVRVVVTLQNVASAFEQRRCDRHEPAAALQVLDAALASRWLSTQRDHLLFARAKILAAAGRSAEALASLEQAIALVPTVPLLQWAVKWSLEAGDPARARRQLAIAERDPRISPRARWTYREEIQGLRQLIELYESLEAAPAS